MKGNFVDPDSRVKSLYHQYKDSLVTLAYRMIGERDSALDMVQDLFVRLLEKPGLLPSDSECAAYLHKSIIHRSTDLLRKKKPWSGLSALPDRPDPAPSSTGEIDEIRPLLIPLTPDQRATVVLKAILGHSLADIARIMDTEEGTVKSRLSRALETMRQAFRKKESP